MSKNDLGPMQYNHEAQDATVERATKMQQEARDTLVTMPAVGDKAKAGADVDKWALVRHNDNELGLLVQQYGLRQVMEWGADLEAKLKKRYPELLG